MSNLGGNSVSEDTDRSNNLQGADGADGVVASIVAGTNIDNIDSSDPANPIINAAAGGSTAVPISFNTNNNSIVYSTSLFAAKGITYDCINAVTIYAVQVPTDVDAAATYKLTIAEVSGASDTVDAITATSATQAATAATDPVRQFIFSAGVTLVAGKTYSFLIIRTDGTTTSATECSFPTDVGENCNNLEYVASARIASTTLLVSDVLRFSTTAAPHMTFTYTVD